MLSKDTSPSTAGAEPTTRPGATAFDWLTEVHLDSALKLNDLRVASRLARYANWVDRKDAGKTALEDARPGATRIAHDLGMERPNVYKHLKKLETRGWAVKVSKGGIKGQQRRASEYKLTFPAAMSIPGDTHTDPAPVDPTSIPGDTRMSIPSDTHMSIPGDTPPEHSHSSSIATTTHGRRAEKKEALDNEGRPTPGIPLNWTPKAEHKALSDSRGLHFDYEVESYRDHNVNTDPRDWDDTFTRWLTVARVPKADTYRPRPTAKKAPPRAGDHADWMNLSRRPVK